ncbi:undecaprenyl-phosphate glucose phosphotransferase [Aridibaculum aurantiacum]|uniref:undecaprenyl-phosphate glucose phosphotransferase n=1 Tax=Aridibaculum aurantiacum TaxID=2810307 RepID=UPI001A97AF4C|nr:undecaprenyl-phosphate glucose phosphotransferase [Aridibaculum aurantiacum]
MNNRFLRSLQVLNASIDFISLNFIFLVCLYIFRKSNLIGHEQEYLYFGFALSTLWLGTVVSTNIYHEKHILSFESFTKATITAYIYLLLGISIYLFFFRMIALSRLFLSVLFVALPIMLLINRFFYLHIFQYLKSKSALMSKVMVIGYNNLSKKLVSYLEEDGINKEIVGFCEEYENVHELSEYPILSNIGGAMEVCRQHGITEIYSTIAPEHNQNIYKLIQTADDNCIRFKIVPDLGIFMNQKMHIDFLKEIPVMMLRREPLEDISNRLKKRLFDVFLSSLVLIFILSWLIPLIAIILKLESKGPVFFAQPRTGKDKKTFMCLKFRSMRVNSQAHEKQATLNDDRITKVGRFLRKTSLDEFPQFINVFMGQMSIVGPRPHMLKHTDEYSQIIGKYMVRQFLKPGITGWAQVNGFRGETKTVHQMQKRVEYDLWYMENWSIYLDLKMVFLTAYNMIKGEKNAF